MNKKIFCEDSQIVYYVPGYLSGEDNQDETLQKLEEFFECDKHEYNDPYIRVFKWKSVTSYAKALHNSYEAADELISWLKDEVSGPVTLVGHSLGALVILNAMRKIPRKAYYAPIQVIFIGAAIDSRADLSYMCSVTEYPVANIVNPNDVVLSTVYRTCTDSYALGQVGSKRRNRNYVELELLPKYPSVAGSLLGEVANQLLDITGHSASRVYLDSLIKGKYRIK